MRDILDTLIWIANYPATYGYACVFIAAFGAIGLLMLAARSPRVSRADSTLRRLRRERGLPHGDAPAGLGLAGALRRWFFGLLSVVVLGGGAIGLASLVFGPITAGYIYGNGVSAEAETVDSDYVRFTAENGTTYTLHHNFFTPQSYPGDETLAFADRVVVRYLPGHPQAFVLDTRASTDAFGDPLGG